MNHADLVLLLFSAGVGVGAYRKFRGHENRFYSLAASFALFMFWPIALAFHWLDCFLPDKKEGPWT